MLLVTKISWEELRGSGADEYSSIGPRWVPTGLVSWARAPAITMSTYKKHLLPKRCRLLTQ